jgi:hypothetical protein
MTTFIIIAIILGLLITAVLAENDVFGKRYTYSIGSIIVSITTIVLIGLLVLFIGSLLIS